MKKIYSSFVILLISVASFAQPGIPNNNNNPGTLLKLSSGQKILVESTTQLEASFGMGMEMNSNSTAVNILQVKNSIDKLTTVSNTLTKLKLDMNMMGQPNNYDSENKAGNNTDMAKIFDERLNKTVDIDIDNNTGIPVEQKKIVKAKDTDGGNPADDLMKMFSNTSDDAMVSGAFELIPAGKSIGDKWSDTTDSKDMRIIRTYTLKSITGTEALILLDVATKAVNMLNFQEMEFEIKSNTKTNGEIITDVSTGLVKKRTSNSDITGSLQMMGQDMPISAKSNSTILYK